MIVTELRDEIRSLISDELGTYGFANGGTTPALIILDSGDSVPGDRQVSGLEVVIRRNPNRKPKSVFNGVQRVKSWQIFLIQWAGNYTIAIALDKIEQRFVGAQSINLGVNEQQNQKEQISVQIPDLTEFAVRI